MYRTGLHFPLKSNLNSVTDNILRFVADMLYQTLRNQNVNLNEI
jgi:hypothetical protein